MKDRRVSSSNRSEESTCSFIGTTREERRAKQTSAARTGRGSTSTKLLIAVSLAILIGLAGGIVIGVRYMRGLGTQGTKTDSPQESLGLLNSLNTSDEEVERLVAAMSDTHTSAVVSGKLNERGWFIYLAEKDRAEANQHVYSKEEIQRALRWFERAHELDRSAVIPPWNAACMYGLLGDVGNATRRLDDLKRVVPSDRQSEFNRKVATDTDFCPVERLPAFTNYLKVTWKIQRHAPCPEPAIQTR